MIGNHLSVKILFPLFFILAPSAQPLLAQRGIKTDLVVQTGHSWSVKSVAFSPDGRTLASGSHDHTIKIWDVQSGSEIRTLLGHSDDVFSVSFSPDRKTLASGSADQTIKLWNVESGDVIQTLSGHVGSVRSVSFNSNGKMLASGSGDKTIKLWDVESGAVLRTLAGHTEGVNSISFSPDGRTLASGSWDKTIKLWDTESGKELRTLPDHAYSVTAVAFSPDGKTLASGSGYNEIKIWDVESGKQLRALDPGASFPGTIKDWRTYPSAVTSLSFGSHGKTLAAGFNDARIRIWNVGDGRALRMLYGHSLAVNSVCFGPDGETLASGGSSPDIKIWEARSGKELKVFSGHMEAVTSVSFNMRGNLLAFGRMDRTINLWDLESGKELRTLPGHDLWVESVSFSPDGRTLASGGADNSIKLWDVASGQSFLRLWREVSIFSSVAFSSDGQTLAGGNNNNTITLLDVRSGREFRTLKEHSSHVNSVAFCPGTRMLASGSSDKTVKLWDIDSGEVIQTLGYSGNVESVSFTSDGTILAAAGYGDGIKTWDVASKKELRTFGAGSGYSSISFSPNGNTLASGSGQVIKLWDVKTGKETKVFIGHTAYVRAVSLSPDGKTLASGSDDTTVKLWEVASGRELCSLIALDNDDWVVVTREGRFDTNKNLDSAQGLHWVVSDEPLTPLPLEVFMRDYYEPKLLPRLLKCTEEGRCDREFKPIRDLSSLNRTQPKVEIKKISPAASPDTVEVSVEVTNVISETQRDTRGRRELSFGVYDLRLFRGGQLVGYSTSNEKLQTTFRNYKNFDDELSTWREANKIDLIGGKKTFAFSVKLPRNLNAKETEFSAYAFNEDRIKSDTATASWPATETAPSTEAQPHRKPRAYVIAVGVNANENPAFNLHFAANDARRFQEVLPQRLAATGEYSEVVSVSLISDWRQRGSLKVTTRRDATKANFKALLDLLAGHPVAEDIKRAVPSAQRLHKAAPDDLILILFSSHGYADANGLFYFIPYDTGPGVCTGFTETMRQRSISSDELSLWMRDVDGGQMTLIVDACYSTTAIEGSGFKPAPMGSRGLGQLAYDKRMRILTATQADNVAMELPATASGRPINHGLLSYALLDDGLGAKHADFKPFDKTIFMDEWLEYAVVDVPKLFAEQPRAENQMKARTRIRNGRAYLVLLKRQLVDTGSCGPMAKPASTRAQEQQPSLFDFTRRKREVALVRNP